MNLRDALDVSDTTQGRAARLMQVVLVGISLYGLYQGNFGIVFNALIPLGVTFLPAVLERDYHVSMDAGLTLWLTTAVFLHAVGSLGPYQNLPWYDAVAHALSSSVVAGAGYATLRAFDLHSEAVRFPPKLMFVFILVFVMAFGVFWEILEFASGGITSVFGGKPVLAQYGTRDIINDLVFDQVGALAVALWGTAHLSGVARSAARTMDE